MLQAAENYILVEIEKKFQDTHGNLLIDTTWEPQEYATLEGIVVSAPVRTKSDLQRKIVGSVKKGDKIFFSYAVIYDYVSQPDHDTPVYRNLVLYEGKEYWKVEIGEVFCSISDNNIEMVTENILLEPKTEDTGIIKAMPSAFSPLGTGAISCNVRDEVCFEPKYVQKYNILGSEHYIIPSRRVLAKV